MWLFRLLMLYSVFGSYLYYCPDSTDSPLHLVYRSSTESKPSNSHSLSVFPKTSFLNDTVFSTEQSGSSIDLQLQIQEFNNQSETVGYDYNHSLTELPKVSLLNTTVNSTVQFNLSMGVQHHIPTFDYQSETVGFDYFRALGRFPRVSCNKTIVKKIKNVKSKMDIPHFREFNNHSESVRDRLNIPTNVTLVYTTKLVRSNNMSIRINRMGFFDRTLQLWKGYVIACVYCLKSEEESLIQFIESKHYPSRFHIILYIVEDTEWNASIYPMNAMRNIAIEKVKTTHYLVLDMDEWFIDSLESEIATLPSSIMEAEDVAIVVPLVIMNTLVLTPRCCSLDSCVQM